MKRKRVIVGAFGAAVVAAIIAVILTASGMGTTPRPAAPKALPTTTVPRTPPTTTPTTTTPPTTDCHDYAAAPPTTTPTTTHAAYHDSACSSIEPHSAERWGRPRRGQQWRTQ